MSSEQSSEQTSRPPADTSIQRRVKFGTNVALTIVVAIVIVVLINAMAYRYLKTMRVDATYSRRYSLSRQTINLARSLKKQYRIVTLIAQSVEEIEHAKSLIGEYERYSDKLTVEHLNPITSRGDQFKKTLLARYETRLEPVREAIEEGRKAVTEAAALLTPYADRLEALRKSGALTGIEQVGFIRQVSSFVERYPQGTSDLDRVIDQKLELTLPDYDGVLRDLREMVEVPEQNLAQIVTIFSAWIDDELTASALKEQVIPLRDEMGQTRKQLADRVSRLRGLEGLDDYNRVRRELENPDTVMIMSDDEVRVIALASMFRRDTSQEAQQQAPEQKDEALLFTGEEQITGALVGMEMEQKPMVIFVSSAQQPATGPRGVFAGVAERLRTMNFQVEDWNPSGQRPPMFPGQPPQPPTPQPPPEPEPGQRVVWVVPPSPPQNPGMPPQMAGMADQQVAGAVGSALSEGHGALMMFMAGFSGFGGPANALVDVIAPYGVEPKTDRRVLRRVIAQDGRSRSRSDLQIVHWPSQLPVTAAISGLPGVFVQSSPIEIDTTKGETVKQWVLARATGRGLWVETDLFNRQPKYDEAKAVDEVNLAVAAEKDRSRLVVVADPAWATDEITTYGCLGGMCGRGMAAVAGAQFPANAELFVNSVYWLAGLEELIGASARTQDIRRIGEMSEGGRTFVLWTLPSVMLVLALAIGMGVWLVRRGG